MRRGKIAPTLNFDVDMSAGQLFLQICGLLQQLVDRVAGLLLGIQTLTQQCGVDFQIRCLVLRGENLANRRWN